jgi:hypothetical protein
MNFDRFIKLDVDNRSKYLFKREQFSGYEVTWAFLSAVCAAATLYDPGVWFLFIITASLWLFFQWWYDYRLRREFGG